MKIELKKIHVNEQFSQETTMFQAGIYVNGVFIGHARNDGMGGPTMCRPYPAQVELFKEAQAYCLSLPPKQYDWGSLKSDMEGVVDDLLTEYLEKKDKKKFERDMKKGIEGLH